MSKEAKFILRVEEAERAFRVEKEASEALKGAISRKMISKMKKEYVECPLLGKKVPFLKCFACISFIRRVKGHVHCTGEGFKLKF
ncbi:MAG: hypothetical protein N3F65_01995 [Nitrososphaeria archaeon]|nr:hypothetical protein [Aigarchaeota archaeon]MCX8187364.1 hypothetical protein [Nitrososphaeria archaeon]MDW8021665.1 hypothetical protein [Nitrososphaerota archaeon]